MRLIDADALWKRLNDEPWENNADRDEIALPFVNAAPPIDAVVVTRCKDCIVRRRFAIGLDMHFWGDDCPYKCDTYETWNRRAGEEDKHETV